MRNNFLLLYLNIITKNSSAKGVTIFAIHLVVL